MQVGDIGKARRERGPGLAVKMGARSKTEKYGGGRMQKGLRERKGAILKISGHIFPSGLR